VKLWRLMAVLVCASVIALVLGACGGDDDDDDGGGTSAATSTAPAPQGAPIKLGGMCSCTGAQAANLRGAKTTLEAWADHVNNSGGINGHPVELTVLDDAGDPAKALQNAKQLVEQNGVVAMVGFASLADSAVAPYLDQKGIPVVGGLSIATFVTDPNWFASNANTVIGLAWGSLDVTKNAGKSHIGVTYCAESPICAELIPLMQGLSSILGVEVTAQKVSATAPNYTAPCLQLKDAGVDALFPAAGGETVQRVVASCKQQGWDPLIIGQATTATQDQLEDPNLQGALNSGPAANPYDDSLPAVKEMRDALDSYQDGFTDGAEFAYSGVMLPWTGGILFEEAATAGKLGPDSTSADVKKAIYALKTTTLDGLSGTLIFTPGQPTQTPCYFTETIEDDTLVSGNDNKPTCLTEQQGAQVKQVLSAG
jgi:branched-chain amino acid transport system substrate-binding protein